MRKKAVDESGSGEPSITYLRAKNLLPFFYRCLFDKDKSVRQSALISIKNFGPQGELLFIEGVTKEPSANVRAECAQGLGRIGVSAFRTLLLTLSDREQIVRDTAASAILRHTTIDDILNEYHDKKHQV